MTEAGALRGRGADLVAGPDEVADDHDAAERRGELPLGDLEHEGHEEERAEQQHHRGVDLAHRHRVHLVVRRLEVRVDRDPRLDDAGLLSAAPKRRSAAAYCLMLLL